MEKPAHSFNMAATIDVIGGKWKPLVLWHLHFGEHRFGELRRAIPGVSEKMLPQHLRELEADGIISRRDLGGVPPRVEYALTEFGNTLINALRPLCEWGQAHMERIAAAKGLKYVPLSCAGK